MAPTHSTPISAYAAHHSAGLATGQGISYGDPTRVTGPASPPTLLSQAQALEGLLDTHSDLLYAIHCAVAGNGIVCQANTDCPPIEQHPRDGAGVDELLRRAIDRLRIQENVLRRLSDQIGVQ